MDQLSSVITFIQNVRSLLHTATGEGYLWIVISALRK
ncbi:MAG: hypothetical protein ACI84C_001172 [Flavobacteriales bacterium]|jgi:hypothetical protein